MKESILKKAVAVLVTIASCALLSLLTAPLFAHVIIFVIEKGATSTSLVEFHALNPLEYLNVSFQYFEHLKELGYGFIYPALMLFFIAIIGLSFYRYRLLNPNRNVRSGVLGQAEIFNTPRSRKSRNTYWSGDGNAPGASLVYGFEHGSMIGDPNFTHGIVVAKSGCGKSRSIGYASLFWNVKANASMIYTARKLTDYKLTYQAIEKEGYKTFLLDLEKPKRGHRFNLMDTVNRFCRENDIAGAQRSARQLAQAFIKHDEKNPYFSNSARALFASTILIVAMANIPDTEKNLVSVAQTIRIGLTGNGKDPGAPLKDYIRSLGADHPAYRAAVDALQDNGTTAGRNVASTLMTAITVLGDEGIEWMLSGSDFTLKELAEKKCVLFPHCLGEDDPYNTILSALYSQLWTTLQEISAEHGESLPHPFVILGDEWGNLPYVPCLGEMVSLGRSMGLHVFVFVQNLSQLNKYNQTNDSGAGVDKLLGSMNLQIAMSVMKTEPDGRYFSDLAGKKTILTRSETRNHTISTSGSSNGSSLQEHQIELIPAYTLKDRVPLRDGIIVIKGGENTAPGNEGVFEMPVVDATKIKAVSDFFHLGTKKEDERHCMEIEMLLSERAAKVDPAIPSWSPRFQEHESEKIRQENVENDDLALWL